MILQVGERKDGTGLQLAIVLTRQDMRLLSEGLTATLNGETLAQVGLPGVAEMKLVLGHGSDEQHVQIIKDRTGADVPVFRSKSDTAMFRPGYSTFLPKPGRGHG